ncbi:MAG: PEGA domain-containing protein [Bacteroidaceae bacterium]|nr:PEGA domain-containing protein [Bacteroidaceae bacterium]
MITKTPYLRFLALFALLAFAVGVHAQELLKFSVASFQLDPFDQTALNPEFEKIDGSGYRYAIIKVTSDNPDDKLSAFRFNFFSLRHEVREHNGELWVYVQKNAKRVTITREGYVPLNRYDLGTAIQDGKVYTMMLSVTAAPIYTQMVQFTVQPVLSNAVVMVKSEREGAVEELFGTTDETGSVAKSLPLGAYTYRVIAENCHPTEGTLVLNDRTQTLVEEVPLQLNGSEVTLRVDADADIFINGEKKGRRTWTGSLKAGTYYVECQQANHRNSSQNIVVEENRNRTIDLTRPTPITGTLAITSRPLGANIDIDGKDYGLTPQNINDLLIGQHTVTLSKERYSTEKKPFEIKEKQTTQLEVALTKTGGEAEGEKAKPSTKSKTKTTVQTKAEPQKSSCFYLQAFGQFVSLTGIGLGAGAYFSNVNVEASFLFGLPASDDIYWSNSSSHLQCNYKCMTYGAKLGYGIRLIKNRFRLTPQVGASLSALHSHNIDWGNTVKVSDGGSASNAYVGSVVFGLKADYAFTSHFGVFLSPEMSVAINKSKIYTQLADVSSTIKAWGSGFNLRLGLRYSF